MVLSDIVFALSAIVPGAMYAWSVVFFAAAWCH